MTVDEMREAIEAPYRAVVPGDLAEVPSDITPMSWSVGLSVSADDASPEEFRLRYAEPAGNALAHLGLQYGCDRFAALRFEDRPAVKVMNANGVRRQRPREFIVHALGWSSKPAPQYQHEPVWPHAIGAKGDTP